MSSNLEHAAIKALAWVIGIGSAVMTGYFGSNFGGDHWFFVSLMFVIFFAISVLCPLLVNWTTSFLILRQWGRFAALLLFAVFFVFVDIVTNGGTSSFLRKSDLVITENQNTKAKDARNEVTRLEKRAVEIRATTAWKGAWQSPAAYDDMIEAARLIRDNEAKRGGCGPLCEQKTMELAELTAAKANALQREALKKELLNIEMELRAAKVASAETPTRASAALTHAKNLAAGLTGMIDPGETETFWANYKLSALTGLAVTFANIAAAILLAFSGAMQRHAAPYDEPHRQPWETRPLADMRPNAAQETARGQTIVLQSQEDHTDDSLSLLMEAVERINRKYAT